MSDRKFLLTFVFAAVAFTFSQEAPAPLTTKSTTTTTQLCPDGSTPINGVCPPSSLGGSVWWLFTDVNIPGPVRFANDLPATGPDYWFTCEQTTGIPCPDGVPTVQATGLMTILKSNKTITGPFNVFAGFPLDPLAAPFKVQVVETSAPSGDKGTTYTVVGNDGTKLTLLERPAKNVTTDLVVAFTNIKLVITNKLEEEGAARVYMRHYNLDGTCVQSTVDVGFCEEGAATVMSGFFNAQSSCTWDGTKYDTPCEVQAFASDGQEATFKFTGGQHNISACGFADCYISWGNPPSLTGSTCKKYFPETTNLALCQTLGFTIFGEQSVSNFYHRAWNSAMTTEPSLISALFKTVTSASGAVLVEITANPNPLNRGNSTTSQITVKILNNGLANLAGIDSSTGRIVLANLQNVGGPTTAVVQNVGFTACDGESNCWNFKFNRNDLLCKFASINPERVSEGTVTAGDLPITLVASYSNGGGVEGSTIEVIKDPISFTPCP